MEGTIFWFLFFDLDSETKMYQITFSENNCETYQEQCKMDPYNYSNKVFNVKVNI